MSTNEFSVYQYFPDDSYERIREFVSAEEAMRAFQVYTNNPASMIGITRRVIITDGGDLIVAEWKFGEGIVFPPEWVEVEKLAKAKRHDDKG